MTTIIDTPRPLIFGLSGYARSGKDTVGELLIRNHGFVRLAFADALKHVAYQLGWDGQKDERGRRLLQEAGMIARSYNPDHWVNQVTSEIAARRRDTPDVRIVVTDVRFPNEAGALASAGAHIVRVNRKQVGPVNNHASERALDKYDFGWVVQNDGTLGDLDLAVHRMVNFYAGRIDQ